MKLDWRKRYFVICREDTQPSGEPGKYVFASSRFFTKDEAETYCKTVSPTREPEVCEIKKSNAWWVALAEKLNEESTIRDKKESESEENPQA